MLPKIHRLTSKDINYILKRRQYIVAGDFLFYFVPQCPNRSYNQFAIQLSTKLHKQSNRRNKLKRMYYQNITTNGYVSTKLSTHGFMKTIALPHKAQIDQRHQLLNNKDWEVIQQKVNNALRTLFHKAHKSKATQ